MNGQMDIDFGLVPILISNHAKNFARYVLVMVNILAVVVNVIKISMAQDASIPMSVPQMLIVVHKENV